MSEGITEREALLEARIKQLEAAAAETAAQRKSAGGGIVEQVWRYFSSYVPPWIIAAGIGVFIAFHAWEYFNAAQITAAETQLQKAQAAIKDAEQAARNTKVGDESLEVATVQAQLKQKQQEAARAKIEADAQNAILGNESARLAQARAALAAKQAEATKTRAAADAARSKSGLFTLTQKEAIAKLVTTQMSAALERISATILSANVGNAAMVRAACEGNQFPELIGCPDQYVQQARREAAVSSAPDTAAAPVPEKTPAPVELRKPTMFDCARASMGTDYVICASPELLDAEARLEDAYNTAHAARGDDVKSEQRVWIKRFAPDCGLPPRGRPSPQQIEAAKDCVRAALNTRIRQLQAEQ